MTEEELMNAKLKEMEQQYGAAPQIDLSAIKNAKAAKTSKEFKEKITSTVRKEKKNKFCFTQEERVKLPTGGYLYKDLGDEEVASGYITIRPMSFSDEEVLSNQSFIKNGTVFIELLKSCVVNDIDVKKLSPYDVYYLIYTLRKITYGENYKFKVTCPKCGKEYEKEVDISNVEWEEITEEDNVNFVETIKLPVSKYTITIEMPTLGNEEESNKISKKYDVSETILNYITRTIEILDDKGEPLNPKDYGDFFEALPGRDRAEISKAFQKVDNLKIPIIDLECPRCHEEDSSTIPFSKDFFRY